jgi:hypothetical protein
MKLFELLRQIKSKLQESIDKRQTGMLSIEVHLRQGGIGKVFITDKKEVVKDKTAEIQIA